MKKLFFTSVIAFFLVVFVVTPVFAQTRARIQGNNSSPSGIVKERVQDRMEKKTANRLDRAQEEVTRRITALQQLLNRIQVAERLSATVKTTLLSQIQAEIDALTALQTKITSGLTEIVGTDLQAIRDSYQSSALFVQKAQILATADRIMVTADLMSSQAARLQTNITEKQSAGNDVTELQRLLADMEGNIADAKTDAGKAIATVMPLTVAGYPANKTELQTARQLLRTGHKSLLDARYDANQIIVGLLKMTNTNRVSITPKVTCIPRPACLDATPACQIAEPATGWCPAR